jgi:hypothetical protein
MQPDNHNAKEKARKIEAKEASLRQIFFFIKMLNILFLLLTFPFSGFTASQPDYNASISNMTNIEDNSAEFDVVINSNKESFILTSYQGSFLLNVGLKDAGRLSFKYIDGTSQLSNPPILAVGVNNIDERLELTFASMPGADTITQSTRCIGRFILQYKVKPTSDETNITWDFDGDVSTILTGESFLNITNPAYHTYNYNAQPKYALGKNNSNKVIPKEFQLFQNYPNPFNPSTTINFSIPNSSLVSLKIYDALGREETNLVNEIKSAGNYEVTFNASEFPSGIYYYKLRAGNFIAIKKMTLVK